MTGTLVALIGAMVLLLLALDGIAYMIGRRTFPAMRFAVKLVRRMIGGTFVAIGRGIAGGGKGSGNRRR